MPALAAGPETARAARIGFESWPEGATAGAAVDGRVRWTVAAPDPRAEDSRRGFNVRSAGSFPLWGWKPGRYQDLWSATGEFALRVEAPPGEYLLAIVVGEYDEGGASFELRVGEKVETECMRARMPQGVGEG